MDEVVQQHEELNVVVAVDFEDMTASSGGGFGAPNSIVAVAALEWKEEPLNAMAAERVEELDAAGAHARARRPRKGFTVWLTASRTEQASRRRVA